MDPIVLCRHLEPALQRVSRRISPRFARPHLYSLTLAPKPYSIPPPQGIPIIEIGILMVQKLRNFGFTLLTVFNRHLA
jgi:hypothetical protein